MLAIIGKATPNKETGDVELYLSQFAQMYEQKRRFAYAWSFNPDQTAVDHVRHSLAHDTVYLYLPCGSARSRLRMHVVDFYHDRHVAGTPCPVEWDDYCIKELKGMHAFDSTVHGAIHIWLLIDSIESLTTPVELLSEFAPVFKNKYESYGRNFFAFRST